ncbi:MAG: 3-hydroxyacyl-ACP dehydratase FabZ [bacterium]|nr:3-hydroxyacyl-ACP dehydratase FabZ [bacterium]
MNTSEEIFDLIPHRYPMLLVDRILELDTEANSIVAMKNVSLNEAFFQGHFPGRPVMPGVLQIEALAQASLLCIFKLGLAVKGTDVFFAGIDSAKFRRVVFPGDQLRLESQLVRNRGKFWKMKCTASVDGEISTEAVINAISA